MKLSLIGCRPSPQSLLNVPARGVLSMDCFNSLRRKDKVIVVMGATGTGKSKLSIDLATRLPAEIINSDKMQVYQGLDIVTNKVTEEEQRSIPHHLLGVVDEDAEFTASDFRLLASLAVKSIVGRNKLPLISGGSNSFIQALVDDEELEFRSKYDCCFLWMDVSFPVLHSFVSERVDKMVEAGLVDEVRKMFDPEADYTCGIRRAIGVPEMDRYLRLESTADETTRARLLAEAIDEIKANTCKLACCQLQKIHRLRHLSGWMVNRIDATEVFLKRGAEAEEAWDKIVSTPTSAIVEQFLHEDDEDLSAITCDPIVAATTIGGACAATIPTAVSASAAGGIR